MSSDPHEVEVYPDEVKSFEGSVPLFLKIVYAGFTCFGFYYFFVFMHGDTSSALVKAFNAATGH